MRIGEQAKQLISFHSCVHVDPCFENCLNPDQLALRGIVDLTPDFQVLLSWVQLS